MRVAVFVEPNKVACALLLYATFSFHICTTTITGVNGDSFCARRARAFFHCTFGMLHTCRRMHTHTHGTNSEQCVASSRGHGLHRARVTCKYVHRCCACVSANLRAHRLAVCMCVCVERFGMRATHIHTHAVRSCVVLGLCA